MIDDELGSIRALCGRAMALARGSDLAGQAAVIVDRLEGPLRVAIVGRAKAGKSTLLNCLVGERLAATDASECTRLVTWYRHASGYGVRAHLHGRGAVELPFRRVDGTLEVTLGGLAPVAVDRLEVGWPSNRLVGLTLIDTPGLASLDQEATQRTLAALLGSSPEDDPQAPLAARQMGAGVADAVIYLLRHLHQQDADFLEAFAAGSLALGSPVDSLAVLSRADELGAGRPDAMDSARRIADRYARDDHVRRLVTAVVPIAGLLAETALTLQETEAAQIRRLAALAREDLDLILLSVDRFRFSDGNPLPPMERDRLLLRMGMFGLRHSVDLVRRGDADTAAALSRALVAESGLGELQDLLTQRFAARARSLKARSALAALRTLADGLARRGLHGTEGLMADLERLEASTGELALLRLLHLSLTGQAQLQDEERSEVERLSSMGTVAGRLGMAEETSTEGLRLAALASVERWRTRSSSPLVDRRTSEAAEIAARAYEQVYARL